MKHPTQNLAQHNAAAGAPRILTISSFQTATNSSTNIAGEWLELVDASADLSISFDQGIAVRLFPGEIYQIPFQGFEINASQQVQCTIRIGQGGAKPITRQRLPRRYVLTGFDDVALLAGASVQIWGLPIDLAINAFMDLLICPTADCRIGDNAVGETRGVLIAAKTVLRVPATSKGIWAFSTAAGNVSLTGICAQ